MFRDVFRRGVNSDDPLGVGALFADGQLDAAVLRVYDTNTEGPPTTLCPASQVSVAAGKAAFLRPESNLGTATCPGGSRNGDADVADEIVHRWTGGTMPVSLGRAGAAVSMSPTWVAALIAEAGDGVNYNTGAGDMDQDDLVVQLHAVSASPGTWVETDQAADVVQMSHSVAVFITPEADQGNGGTNLNPGDGDTDTDDRVLQLYYAEGPDPNLVNVGQAAEEFVVGEPGETVCGERHLVAFRTSEAAQGANLNGVSGDTDLDDDVLQVYDLGSRTRRNTGQAIRPCQIVECDPRRPYRVDGSKVTFLTFEPDQNDLDLTGDGTNIQLVLQVYDFCTDTTATLGAVEGGDDPFDDVDDGAFVSPGGRCDLGLTCNPLNDLCGDGAFCEDDACNTAAGLCRKHTSIACTADADCKRCILRQPPTCRVGVAADCPDGSTCAAQLITAVRTAIDTDDDGVSDDEDNCPLTPNTGQADGNADGFGDLCEPAPLSGKKLLIKDKQGLPEKRKVVMISKDASASGAPAPNTVDDPTVSGAELELSNPTTGETDTFALPASGWRGLGTPPGTKGYKYKDVALANGPCKVVLWKPGKLVKAVCGGPGIQYTLDEPSQGSVAVALSAGARRVCMLFGGTVTHDRPAADGKTGLFKARNAPAAATCAAP